MDIFKLAALAGTAALCALVIRKQVPELAVVLALTAGCLLLGQTVEAFSAVRGLADRLSRAGQLSSEVWTPVWKTVGIGIVTRLSAAVCRDAGEGSVAAFLETAGAVLALLCALPLMEAVLETLGALL